MNKRFCSVLVTFNRLDDLKRTLSAYENQTVPPDCMIIVDNASTDGTKEFLDHWNSNPMIKFPRVLIHTDKNLGGAGGFSLGIKKALEFECDYVFLADDDAVPYKDMFERLLEFDAKIGQGAQVAALCTCVIDQFGFSSVQRGRVKKGLFYIGRENIKESETKKEFFEVDYLTFVGAFIKRKTIEKIGLPITEYFIHEDDAEYSTRIRKVGKIYCVSESKIFHPKGGLNTKNWIEFYTTRNQIDHIRRHYPRRYYYYTIFDRYVKKCSLAAALLRKRSPAFRKMSMTAIKDGIQGKLGLHEIYRPGADIK